MELTVSVSTIIFRTDPSVGFPRAPFPLKDVVDLFGMMVPVPFAPVEDLRRFSSIGSELLLPPLSLPLSAPCLLAFGVASSSIFCKRGSSVKGWLRIVPFDGDEWSLVISCTVSRAGLDPLRPLFTVRGMVRSPLAARSSGGDIEDRLLEVLGWVDSWSGRCDVAHTGMLDLSGLEALVDDSVPERGLRRGGLPACDEVCCNVEDAGPGF